jgi:hypothetical protein
MARGRRSRMMALRSGRGRKVLLSKSMVNRKFRRGVRRFTRLGRWIRPFGGLGRRRARFGGVR